jgi:hypothetical protein
MDTITYTSYGVLHAIAAREARLLLIPEPQFTPFDLSFFNSAGRQKV